MDGRLTPHAPSESYGYSTPNLRLASPCSPSTPHTEYSDDVSPQRRSYGLWITNGVTLGIFR